MNFTTAQLTGALRWAGTLFAGYLVQHAIVTQDATPGIVAAVVGGGTFLWGQIQKMRTKAALNKAALAPATFVSPPVPK